MLVYLVSAAALALVAADPEKEAAIKKGLAAFQGVWTPVSMVEDGRPLSSERLSKVRLTIKGENFTFQTGTDSHDGLYKIDPTRDPKELNIEVTRGDEKGKVYLVIYKFEDGKMIQCMHKNNERRPREFTGEAGSENLYEVWRRVE
jgi:uncharacterized protein (TIGR03067 family)